MKEIEFRSPKTLGCTVASTAPLQSLRESFPDSEIIVYSKFPDLFMGLAEVSNTKDLNKKKGRVPYDIDLENYLDERQPQVNKPLRHLLEHMFEIMQEKLGNVTLKRDFVPKINLTDVEVAWAQGEARRIAKDKPLVWLQTRTRLPEKDIPKKVWQEVITKSSDKYAFVDLAKQQYSRREAIALTAAAHAGITLDSFLLHGSQAVHAPNVIVILVSSHPEVVCYSDQIVVKKTASLKHPSVQSILYELNNLS